MQLFFEVELTWIAWMDWCSPLKVWEGIREQSRVSVPPPLLFSHTHTHTHTVAHSSHSSGRHFELCVWMTMNPTAINEGLQYDTPLGDSHSFSTPFSKVIDLWERVDPVWLLFVNDTELPYIRWALLSSEEMAKVYKLYVGIVTGKIFFFYPLGFLSFATSIRHVRVMFTCNSYF